MTHPTTTLSDTPSPSSKSSSLSSSSPPSQSSHSSTSHHQHNALPTTNRVPPPKARIGLPSGEDAPGQDKRTANVRKDSLQKGQEEDDWFQITNGPSAPPAPSSRGVPIAPRRQSDTISPASELTYPTFSSHLTGPPAKHKDKEKKGGRGRGLAKKTSQLFSRSSRDKEKDTNGSLSPESGTNLQLPSTSRQNSSSSAASGDSTSTSTSSRQRFSIRPGSSSSRPRSPRSTHSRRMSQDSASSSQTRPLPRTGRSGSSSTYDSPPENLLPIPQRQASHLSASVPTLTRQSMPPSATTSFDTSSVPSRMSTWFSHLLPSSSNQSPSDSSSSSPQKKSGSAAASFLNAARQRAVDGVRNLLDSEAQPDKCEETIWVMGSPHPGYRPATPLLSTSEIAREAGTSGSGSTDSIPLEKSESGNNPPTSKPAEQPTSPPPKTFGNIFSSSTLSLALPAGMTGSPVQNGQEKMSAESPSKMRRGRAEKEVLKWPEEFYDDFRSRVWCTYRSQYAPIMALPNSLLIPSAEAYYSAFAPPLDVTPAPAPATSSANQQSARPASSWSWSRNEGGLTSDAGWGCMLRTGQSMLANALIDLHLGRDWRLPASRPSTTPTSPSEKADLEAYATYVKILSWFLDDPSPLCPFSVHRIALIGKELGKEVGEWFGPSTAAGALKTLGNSFPLCGLAVATATDSIIYKSDVISASHRSSDGWTDETTKGSTKIVNGRGWGSKAVLILIGVRLGLDGVNPIYHDSVKALFTFPQSVGIAGGRPSSSYYFVGSQANALFYLDPHFTRPAIPLEIPPAPSTKEDMSLPKPEDEVVLVEKTGGSSYRLDIVNVNQESSSTKTSASGSNYSRTKPATSNPDASDPFTASLSDPVIRSSSLSVIPTTIWYANAYPETALRTFHCDRVKKMPLSALDPSMLLGFLISNQDDFDDFTARVNKLPQKIFTVQNEPPTWDDDDDTGLESVSEPDMDELQDGMAKTSVQPISIPKAQGEDEDWEEDMKATPVRNGHSLA